MTEREKYEAMYAIDEYRVMSPGASFAPRFREKYLKGGETIIDWGCGPGRAGKYFRDCGHTVYMVDIAENALDDAVRNALDDRLVFVRADMSKFFELAAVIDRADWGYCVDVMEHLPEDQIFLALWSFRYFCTQGTYFQISGVADGCGRLIGEKLHLTVKLREWWHEQLRFFFFDTTDLNPDSKGSSYRFLCKGL